MVRRLCYGCSPFLAALMTQIRNKPLRNTRRTCLGLHICLSLFPPPLTFSQRSSNNHPFWNVLFSLLIYFSLFSSFIFVLLFFSFAHSTPCFLLLSFSCKTVINEAAMRNEQAECALKSVHRLIIPAERLSLPSENNRIYCPRDPTHARLCLR